MKQYDTVLPTLRIRSELAAKARAAAKAERRNLSDFIRLAIEDRIEKITASKEKGE